MKLVAPWVNCDLAQFLAFHLSRILCEAEFSNLARNEYSALFELEVPCRRLHKDHQEQILSGIYKISRLPRAQS